MLLAVMCGMPYWVRTTFALIGYALASAGTAETVPIAVIAAAMPNALTLTRGRLDRNFARRAGSPRARGSRFGPVLSQIAGWTSPAPLTTGKCVSKFHPAVRERERATKAKVESLSKETREASSLEGYE